MTRTEQTRLNLDLRDPEREAEKVNRLRFKLGEKAKQEPKFRFYSLYQHIFRMDVLWLAWEQVKGNRGSPGIDGVKFDDFDTENKVETFLLDIQESLKERTYRPQPVKRVFIPKPNGKLRPLGIPIIRDRVAQQAVKLILEPIFESDFLDCSHGFRTGKNAEGALESIREGIKSGKRSVYDADLKGYFDSIPHDKLMKCLEMRIVDRKMLSLIKMWLRCPILEKNKGKIKKIFPKDGVPQGGVISPLLANVYLHWFDRVFHAYDGPANWAKAQLVRYADDFVILAYHQSDKLTKWVESKINGWLGLKINKEKTTIVDLNKGQTLEFLGFSYRFVKDRKGRSRKYLEMAPSKKAVAKERDTLRELISYKYNWMPVLELIDKVNTQIAGWSGYFRKGYYRKAMRNINYYLIERLTQHLMRRSQRRYRPPKGSSMYKQLYNLGLKYL
jgi:RNA-directed DNA polymerase